jgi:hypothetical protein
MHAHAREHPRHHLHRRKRRSSSTASFPHVQIIDSKIKACSVDPYQSALLTCFKARRVGRARCYPALRAEAKGEGEVTGRLRQ